MMCVNFAGNWKCIKVLYSQNFSKHFNQSLVIYMWIMMKNCFFCSHCCENVDNILKLSPPTPQKFCHNFDWVLHIFICSDLPKVMGNVGEQVNKTVNEFLSSHGFSARDEAQQRLLVGQITEMSSKDNRIYKLLCKLCSFQDSGPHYFSLVILIQNYAERVKWLLCKKYSLPLDIP